MGNLENNVSNISYLVPILGLTLATEDFRAQVETNLSNPDAKSLFPLSGLLKVIGEAVYTSVATGTLVFGIYYAGNYLSNL
ncbi:hypothetical protein J4476_00460 [Candidatus Woesearchaeota archaeon]|nr:hypothetical protein [Candidatus Woesearchaeota archaeon]